MGIDAQSIGLAERMQVPSRFRKVQSSAKRAGVREVIENLLGLPRGSVRFVRSDATVAALKAHWGN